MTTRAATIIYPETDGMPLPDGEYQSPLFRRVVGDLEDHFRDVPGAHVNSWVSWRHSYGGNFAHPPRCWT